MSEKWNEKKRQQNVLNRVNKACSIVKIAVCAIGTKKNAFILLCSYNVYSLVLQKYKFFFVKIGTQYYKKGVNNTIAAIE